MTNQSYYQGRKGGKLPKVWEIKLTFQVKIPQWFRWKACAARKALQIHTIIYLQIRQLSTVQANQQYTISSQISQIVTAMLCSFASCKFVDKSILQNQWFLSVPGIIGSLQALEVIKIAVELPGTSELQILIDPHFSTVYMHGISQSIHSCFEQVWTALRWSGTTALLWSYLFIAVSSTVNVC